MPMMISFKRVWLVLLVQLCSRGEGENDGKMKGGQCLNTLCLRSGDSRTGIFQEVLQGGAT